MGRIDQPLELRQVSERNLRESVRSLSGYLKFASMIWIRALRQPILDGLIVRSWSIDAKRALNGFCDRHGCDEVLIRIDTLHRRWSERRGGYIVPSSKARALVNELNSEGKIAAFLEPLSPYRDRYSLAAITDTEQETMTIEVVGRGFDASDLMRSDSLPHERFEASVPNRSRILGESTSYRRTYLVPSSEYRRTVEDRLVKIGARSKNPAYPRAVIESAGAERVRLAEQGLQYLNRTKQTSLLSNRDQYEPIPRRFLERFRGGVGHIIEGLRRYGIRLGPLSLSGTFSERGRFVFWDFFPADLANAKQLYLNS